MFFLKQIIWAKPKGYPWWPAQISKLPSPDHNYFKVCFIGQNNHALLQPRSVRKYIQYYNQLAAKKYKGLQNSIDLANIEMQKRKDILEQQENKNKQKIKTGQKVKKIKKRNKKKLKLKQNLQKEKSDSQQNSKENLQKNNLNMQPLKQPKNSKNEKQSKQQKQVKNLKNSIVQKNCIKSQSQSICASEDYGSEQFQLEQQYLRKVDRKKIEITEQHLVSFITRFNSHNYEKQKDCYEAVLKVQKQQFKPQELLQSKITNMISYIYKKLTQKVGSSLKKDQIQKLNDINTKLKQKVVNFLFDTTYYDQYLKRMEKKVDNIKPDIIKQETKVVETEIKRPRKYKRKLHHRKIQKVQSIK